MWPIIWTKQVAPKQPTLYVLGGRVDWWMSTPTPRAFTTCSRRRSDGTPNRMPRLLHSNRMTSTYPIAYTTRRCTCTSIDATVGCEYPFCLFRRCGRCHLCRHIGVDALPVLTTDEQRFLVTWNQLPNHMEDPRLTAAETRLVFKLADMGLIDA